MSFGTQSVGTKSPPQTVNVTNLGLATVKFVGISTSADFAQTNNCGTSLAAQSSCSISVSSAPTGPGTRTGNLTLTDNAINSQQVVSLSGKGNNGNKP